MGTQEIFTGRAKNVSDAILAINPGDLGMQLVAKEVARGIRSCDNGLQEQNFPIFGGILIDHAAGYAPLQDIADACAYALTGIPPHPDVDPLIYVDCSSYAGGHPFAFAKLIGPKDMIKTIPQLHNESLYYPDIFTKTHANMQALKQWNEKFSREFSDIFESQDPLLHQIRAEEWTPITKKWNQITEAINERHAPYNAVVLFDGLEFASKDFIGEILTPIFRSGLLPLRDVGQTADFRNAIVFVAMRESKKSSGSPLGFKTHQSKEEREQLYRRKKEELLNDPRLGEFAKDVGDQIFLIGDRTPEAQRAHLISHLLKDVSDLFAGVSVRITFPPETIDLILSASGEKSKDDHVVYFDGRLNKKIRKLVRSPLSVALEEGKILRGSSLELVPGEGETTIIRIQNSGEGEPIKGEDLRSKKNAPQENTKVSSKDAAEYTPEIIELDRIARETIKKVLARKQQLNEQIEHDTAAIIAQYRLQMMQQKGPFGGFSGSQKQS